MMGNAAVAADMRREFITRPRLAVTVANMAPAVDCRGSWSLGPPREVDIARLTHLRENVSDGPALTCQRCIETTALRWDEGPALSWRPCTSLTALQLGADGPAAWSWRPCSSSADGPVLSWRPCVELTALHWAHGCMKFLLFLDTSSETVWLRLDCYHPPPSWSVSFWCHEGATHAAWLPLWTHVMWYSETATVLEHPRADRREFENTEHSSLLRFDHSNLSIDHWTLEEFVDPQHGRTKATFEKWLLWKEVGRCGSNSWNRRSTQPVCHPRSNVRLVNLGQHVFPESQRRVRLSIQHVYGQAGEHYQWMREPCCGIGCPRKKTQVTGRHSPGRGIQCLGNRKQTAASERHRMRRGTTDIGDATLLFWFPSREHQWLHLASPFRGRAIAMGADQPTFWQSWLRCPLQFANSLSHVLHTTGGKTTDFPSVCVFKPCRIWLPTQQTEACTEAIPVSMTLQSLQLLRRFHLPFGWAMRSLAAPTDAACSNVTRKQLSTRAVHMRTVANQVTRPSVTRQGPPINC